MPQVAGVATSYDLPQYVGELFQKQRRPNAVLRAIGGLNGGVRTVGDNRFALNVDYQLAAGAQPAILEGADATFSEEDTTQAYNVTQIFQYGFALTYSRMGKQNAVDGLATIPGAQGAGPLNQPGTVPFQLARKLEKMQRDVNVSFVAGAYALPADNATARKTRGFQNAITTNLYDAATTGGTPIADRAAFEAILAGWMDAGMFQSGDDLWVFADEVQLAWLMELYVTATMSQPVQSRTEAGLMIRTLNAKWARLNLVWEPDAAQYDLLFIQPNACRAVITPIPGKGLVFAEPLAQSGSAVKHQLYAEVGLDYGAEWLHGRIQGRGAP